jgi:hypothetical protein
MELHGTLQVSEGANGSSSRGTAEMVGLANNVRYWRARAEEARTIAETLADETSREIMLNIAKDYERMARRAEERQAAQRKSM